MFIENATVIDLTHILDANVPTWAGDCGFQASIEHDYETVGARVMRYEFLAGIGTHMDSPRHFYKDKSDIADIPLENLMLPAYVINVENQVHQGGPDYFVTVDDIRAFEKGQGKISAGLVAVYTGWSKRWQNVAQFRNADSDGQMHFPGFHPEAVELLLERGVKGIGIDTLSPDGSNMEFPVHRLVLPEEKYIIENLNNLHRLPPKGAYLLVLPLKIKDGAESPIRAVGIIP